VFEITDDQTYLDAARRLVSWTTAHLQDADGLFWDNIKLNGEIERTKWSYNSALMIQANVLLHKHTGDERHEREAQRIAQAAIEHWIDPQTGGVKDGGPFAHMLVEAILRLDGPGRTERLQTGRRALQFVHEQVRDPHGWYAEPWDKPQREPLGTVRLIDQASAARAFWVAATEFEATMS
jgi:predicted alpha-1,6-mannanase (GH76 family)